MLIVCLWFCQLHSMDSHSRATSVRNTTQLRNPFSHKFENCLVHFLASLSETLYKDFSVIRMSVWGHCNLRTCTEMLRIEHPLNVMISGVITNNCNVMPLISFPHCHTINSVGGGGLHKVLGSRGWLFDESIFGNRTLTPSHKQENHAIAVRQFLRPHHTKHLAT